MIPYKIHYIKTDLKEVSADDIYNKDFQIKYSDRFFHIEDVEEDFYHILDIDLKERMRNAPMGIKISKKLVTEIYKPLIELINESDNQLLLIGDLIITKKIYEQRGHNLL